MNTQAQDGSAGAGLPDTADHVLHKPSGETWVVAYVRGGELCACGWPEELVRLADCELVKKASTDERQKLLQSMSEGSGSRASYAKDRLVADGIRAAHEAKRPPSTTAEAVAWIQESALPVLENWGSATCVGRSIEHFSIPLYTHPAPSTTARPITALPVFAIIFDDRDRQHEIMSGEDVARARFEQISASWNAHLFVKVKSNSRDDPFSDSNGVVEITPPTDPKADAWREAVQRLVSGFEHVSGIARAWEPDHSSGADRAKWARATEACADVARLLAQDGAAQPDPKADLLRRMADGLTEARYYVDAWGGEHARKTTAAIDALLKEARQ